MGMDMVKKMLMSVVYINIYMLGFGESSYHGGIDNYHPTNRRIASLRSSFLSQNAHTFPTPTILQHSRVYHPIDYGADPTGKLDSTDALEHAIWDAFQSTNDGHLMASISNLGGSEVFLDGGSYKISRPLRLPESGGGNFMMHGGTLTASNDFPTDRYLIELWASSTSITYEDISFKDLMVNSNLRGGGIAIVNSLRTVVDNCYISHFTTNAILIQGGHEAYIKNSFIGQHINIGSDHRERNFSGIGINIASNDNVITDIVIFSASIGILVTGQANMFTGVHCYNKATRWGGTGIYVASPGFTQTRIVNCYFDFTGIVVEDPVQVHIIGSFFLGNAFILIKSIKGVISGLNIVDNMFSGDYTGVQIVQLDQSNETFTRIDQVVVDRNNVRGMVLKSTIARGSIWSNGTTWTIDFSRVLLFSNLIKNVHYTLHATVEFPNHVLRNISSNCVTVESDIPVSATLHAYVDQTMVEYI